MLGGSGIPLTHGGIGVGDGVTTAILVVAATEGDTVGLSLIVGTTRLWTVRDGEGVPLAMLYNEKY